MLDHLDGIAYRRLVSRYGIGKTKLCEIVNKQITKLVNNIEVTKHFWKQLNYSGNHVVDGKYVPVKTEINIGTDSLSTNEKRGKIPRSKKRRKVPRGKVCIWGADYHEHDFLHYEFDFSESGVAFDNYFRTLKFVGYEMRSLTFDDRKSEIMNSAKRYYRNCVFQLCTRHFSQKISKELSVGMTIIRIKSLERKIDYLFDGEESEYIPSSRMFDIKRACRFANEVAELEFKYELLIDFKNIIGSSLSIVGKR